LINELASRKEVSFDEASNDLSAIVSKWNHRLKKGERIELDRVGILFMDAESNLCFEQDRFFNLLLASFGLDQVHFIAQKEVEEIQAEVISINRTIVEPILVEVEEDSVTIKHLPKTLALASSKENEGETAKIVEIAPKKSKSRVWKYVAAACFLPIAFYSIWIPTRTDVLQSGVISIKDFNPFYTSAEGNYTKTAYSEDITFEKNTEPTLQEQIDGLELPNDVIPYRFTEDTYVYVDISELNSAEVAEVETQSTASPEEIIPEPIGVPVIQPNSMNFIVGCFGSKVNAENLVNKLKSEGLNAFILDVKGGLHRVSAGASLSDESISEIRTKAQSLGFQGWLLK